MCWTFCLAFHSIALMCLLQPCLTTDEFVHDGHMCWPVLSLMLPLMNSTCVPPRLHHLWLRHFVPRGRVSLSLSSLAGNCCDTLVSDSCRWACRADVGGKAALLCNRGDAAVGVGTSVTAIHLHVRSLLDVPQLTACLILAASSHITTCSVCQYAVLRQ